MAVISLTITEATTQIISGIPTTVSVDANIPSSIFYTTDGSTPTTFSSIYVGPIPMPTNVSSIVLKFFATNGMDSSAIIEKDYATNIIDDARLPHATVSNLNNASSINSLFPYGTNSPNPTFTYLNPANAGTTVLNPLIPSSSNGFDGSSNPAVYTNQPIDSYKLTYSKTDSEGQEFIGVGNLPSKTTVIGKQTPVEYTQETSTTTSKIFNPRALVIFQDVASEDPTDPVHINRPDFSLENPEIVRDGNILFNTALDGPTSTGSFVNSHFNHRTNEMSYYYFDSSVNRWIISKMPFDPGTVTANNFSDMVFARGSSKVFTWVPFQRRVLS